MSLGKRKGGGNILPLLKFDARNGLFHLEHRIQVAGEWQKEQVDVTDRLRMIVDLANAERGWIRFPRGAPPEAVLVPAGEDPGEAPSEDHREGFRVLVTVDGDPLGRGIVREFMSTSNGAWNGMSSLHDAYAAQVGEHPGQLPKVALDDVVERRYAAGSSCEPTFQIAGWVPRPEEFGPVKGSPLAPSGKRPTPAPQRTEMEDEIPF
jgi:hypothetical protein